MKFHIMQSALRRVATIIVILSSALFLVSCSKNDLSRGKAAEMISESLHLPAVETIQLRKRFLKRSWVNPGSMQVILSGNDIMYGDVQEELAGLQKRGFISVTETQVDQGSAHWAYANVKLTDVGKKLLVTETPAEYQMKANEIVFGEITGIQINEQFHAAEAHYTLKRVNITPFAKDVSTRPIQRTASFSLFDDGWRIQN